MLSFRLFVSGVPGNLTEKDIEDFIYSTLNMSVKATLAKHKIYTDYNQGFGTISSDIQEEILFLQSLRFLTIGYRSLKLSEYLDKEEVEERRQRLEERRVFVYSKHLPYLDLQTIFSNFGTVKEAYPIQDLKTLKVLNFGYVLFEDLESTQRALSFPKLQLDNGIEISIRPFYKQKKNSPSILKTGISSQCKLLLEQHRYKPTSKIYYSIRSDFILDHLFRNIRLIRQGSEQIHLESV